MRSFTKKLPPYRDPLTKAVAEALHMSLELHRACPTDTEVELEMRLGSYSSAPHLNVVALPISFCTPALLSPADLRYYRFNPGISKLIMDALQASLVADGAVAADYLACPTTLLSVHTADQKRLLYSLPVAHCCSASGKGSTSRGLLTLKEVQRKVTHKRWDICAPTWSADFRMAMSTETSIGYPKGGTLARIASNSDDNCDSARHLSEGDRCRRAGNGCDGVADAIRSWDDVVPLMMRQQRRQIVPLHPYFSLELSTSRTIHDIHRARIHFGEKLPKLPIFHNYSVTSMVELEVHIPRLYRDWKRVGGRYRGRLSMDTGAQGASKLDAMRRNEREQSVAKCLHEYDDTFLFSVAQDILSALQYLALKRVH